MCDLYLPVKYYDIFLSSQGKDFLNQLYFFYQYAYSPMEITLFLLLKKKKNVRKTVFKVEPDQEPVCKIQGFIYISLYFSRRLFI